MLSLLTLCTVLFVAPPFFVLTALLQRWVKEKTKTGLAFEALRWPSTGCLASCFLPGPCWLSVWHPVFCSALVGLLGPAIGSHFQTEGVAHSILSGCPTLSLEAASDEDMVVTGCRNKAMLRLRQADTLFAPGFWIFCPLSAG